MDLASLTSLMFELWPSLRQELGKKVFGYESILLLHATCHLSLAFLFISRLSSHKGPSAELCTKLPGASVKEVGHSSAVFFGSAPVCIRVTHGVSHGALGRELGKLVCVFLWAS